jgi:hypothetical protein
MKYKTLFIASLIGLTLGTTGCSDYLDSDYLFKERMSIDDVFSNRDYTNEWLATAYSYMNNGYVQDLPSKYYLPINYDDDMCYGDLTESNSYSQWRTGNYTETGPGNTNSSYQVWSNCYKGIRQAELFVQHIDENTKFTESERADMKGQANFLVAYYYWFMLRLYGPVPIIPDETIDYMKSYDDVSLPRNTYDECVNYITAKLVEAAKGLPSKRSSQEVTRPTRGAALALRAKVLLYAASPLFNGKAPEELASQMVDNKGNRLLPTTYDESKWARAAAAAKDVMELNQYSLFVQHRRLTTTDRWAYPVTITPPYDKDFSDKNWPDGWADIDPFESYRTLFDGDVPVIENPELIFTHGQNQGDRGITYDMILSQLPQGTAHGWNSHCMTLKQCDAYYMADGTDVPGKDKEIGRNEDGTERVTGYMSSKVRDQYPYSYIPNGVSLQFADREPRFYASVAYNGSIWNLLNADRNNDETTDLQVWYYRGTNNGYSTSGNYPVTGIGIKKYVNPLDIGDTQNPITKDGRVKDKVDLGLRYADILLAYAEALNELTTTYQVESWDGSQTYNISRDVNEMKKGVRPVRIRAGLPDYTSGIYANADQFRTKLKRERQIEFFAEGQRYYDLRRWMDAPAEESLPIWGYNMLASEKMADVFYQPILIQAFPCSFSLKMWFWPISQTELKRNRNLTQNPGWTYPE